MSMNTPSDYAYFYNSRGRDRIYDSDSMTDWLTPFFTTGVFNGGLQVLASDPVDMNVTVQTGYVNIEGKVKNFYATTTLTMPVPHALYPRIDTIVVERNDTDRDFTLKVVEGTAAVTPVATAPVRTDTIYQLVLAEVYVKSGETEITQAEITDKRMYDDVCGWVVATVTEIDFSQITEQFDTFFSQYKTDVIDAYTLYTLTMETYEAKAQNDFENWFDDIKDTLSGDVAGNLQNQINDILQMLADRRARVPLLTASGEYILADEDTKILVDLPFCTCQSST